MSPITTNVQIRILYGGAIEQPPVQVLFGSGIELREQLPAGSGSFELHVREGLKERHAHLTSEQAARLCDLLRQLPDEDMSSKGLSLDGYVYDLVVIRGGLEGEKRLSFHWANEDWRYQDVTFQSAWKAVAALAEFVLQIAG
ncbi:MAG: hypothetical protein JW726_11570 [Anaerolineales bacterium]|nr:hypothetical protein [Anaerolineales bacterium]